MLSARVLKLLENGLVHYYCELMHKLIVRIKSMGTCDKKLLKLLRDNDNTHLSFTRRNDDSFFTLVAKVLEIKYIRSVLVMRPFKLFTWQTGKLSVSGLLLCR